MKLVNTVEFLITNIFLKFFFVDFLLVELHVLPDQQEKQEQKPADQADQKQPEEDIEKPSPEPEVLVMVVEEVVVTVEVIAPNREGVVPPPLEPIPHVLEEGDDHFP